MFPICARIPHIHPLIQGEVLAFISNYVHVFTHSGVMFSPMFSVTCTICIEALVTLVAVTVLIDMLCEVGEGERGEGGGEGGYK